ncbi:MAG: hypothetical protein IMW95_11650 [Moorella humiferrea]|nr:hypothetical protein [Moorella humiferrea]
MGKVLIALDEEEQLMLQRICLDKDAGEALEFVLQKIAPKIPKKNSLPGGEADATRKVGCECELEG